MFLNRFKSKREQLSGVRNDSLLENGVALTRHERIRAEYENYLPSPVQIRNYMAEANSRHLTFEKWYSLFYYLKTGPLEQKTVTLANKVGVSQITLRKMRPYIEGIEHANTNEQH